MLRKILKTDADGNLRAEVEYAVINTYDVIDGNEENSDEKTGNYETNNEPPDYNVTYDMAGNSINNKSHNNKNHNDNSAMYDIAGTTTKNTGSDGRRNTLWADSSATYDIAGPSPKSKGAATSAAAHAQRGKNTIIINGGGATDHEEEDTAVYDLAGGRREPRTLAMPGAVEFEEPDTNA